MHWNLRGGFRRRTSLKNRTGIVTLKGLIVFLVPLVFTGLVFLMPLDAEEEKEVIRLYHRHSENCTGDVTIQQEADGYRHLWTVSESQCALCGAVLHDYEFDAECSCGQTWKRTGYACYHSVYGTDPAGCPNYSAVDFDTVHDHVVRTNVCGKTEETQIGLIEILRTETDPVRELTVETLYIGEPDMPDLSWKKDGVVIGNKDRITITANGTYSLEAAYQEDGREYKVSGEIVVNNIDRKGPTIMAVSPETDKPVNHPVVITVTASDSSGLAEEAYSLDGVQFQKENTFEIDQNGEITIYVKDLPGNITKTEAQISNLDYDPPVVSLSASPEVWEEGECEIKVSAKDSVGLAAKAYSFDKGKTWTVANTYGIEESGTVTVTVRDSAGNRTVKSITLTKTEKKVPEPEESSEAEEVNPSEGQKQEAESGEGKGKEEEIREGKSEVEESSGGKSREDGEKEERTREKNEIIEQEGDSMTEPVGETDDQRTGDSTEESDGDSSSQPAGDATEEAGGGGTAQPGGDTVNAGGIPKKTSSANATGSRETEGAEKEGPDPSRIRTGKRYEEENRNIVPVRPLEVKSGEDEAEHGVDYALSGEEGNAGGNGESAGNGFITESKAGSGSENSALRKKLKTIGFGLQDAVKERMKEAQKALSELSIPAKIATVTGTTLTGGTFVAFGLWMARKTAGIYWVDKEGKEHFLSRNRIKRRGEMYEIRIGRNTILKAETDNIRIRLPRLFAGLHHYRPFCVYYKENMYSLHVEKKIEVHLL